MFVLYNFKLKKQTNSKSLLMLEYVILSYSTTMAIVLMKKNKQLPVANRFSLVRHIR